MPFAITTRISRKDHVVDANDDYSSPFAPSGHLAAMADAALAVTRFAEAEKKVVLLPRLSAFSRLVAKPLRRDGGVARRAGGGRPQREGTPLARSLRGWRQRSDVVRLCYPCDMRRPVFAILVSALWVPILLIPFALLYGRLPPAADWRMVVVGALFPPIGLTAMVLFNNWSRLQFPAFVELLGKGGFETKGMNEIVLVVLGSIVAITAWLLARR